MQNFTFHNPVKIVFGRGSIAELPKLVPADAKIMMTYGGGSIRKNGVYDQVQKALRGRNLVEFGGIEPNPRYETCMKAVERVRAEGVSFLLAVVGGSVLDGTKFIAAASGFKGKDPWAMLSDWSLVPADPLPIGCVMTLPATGSEMNGGAVISRDSTQEKLYFITPQLLPRFSILDPETTFTLPPRQTANGVVDAFVHTTEQYLTYPADGALQDRQAEGILLTLIEEGPRVLREPANYAARANLMWCATQALNGLICCGVPQDWATHMIGHELTALYGVDHAQSLAVVLPGVLRHERDRKRAKLLQYAERVWGESSRHTPCAVRQIAKNMQNTTDGTRSVPATNEADENARIELAIEKTEEFFHSLGVGTRFSDYNIPGEAVELVARRLAARGMALGEHGDLGQKAVEEILASRR